MRFAATLLAGLALAACATKLEPVPETGAFSVKYIEIDGDFFLQVEKIGSTQATTVAVANHPNREDWRRRDWQTYAEVLFPNDEVSFPALRELRGSNLVPQGLVSPTPAAIPPCDTTRDPGYAKVQTRIIRKAPKGERFADVTMVTECTLHQGLSPSQYEGIHQRPNPYRFPTRYETIIDLDRDNHAEQRNVRLRNVPKAEAADFIRRETTLSRNMAKDVIAALDRM